MEGTRTFYPACLAVAMIYVTDSICCSCVHTKHTRGWLCIWHTLHTTQTLSPAVIGCASLLPLLQLNDSAADQKESVVHTGTDDIRLLCQYHQWNGMEKLSIWYGKDANELNGTEGLFLHPWIERGEPLEAFVDDVWRSFHLNFSEDVEHLGIKAYRYRLDKREFWSAHHYRRNAIYGSWCPDGLLYMGVTQTPGLCVWCVCLCGVYIVCGVCTCVRVCLCV